jgi:hypothetical protein
MTFFLISQPVLPRDSVKENAPSKKGVDGVFGFKSIKQRSFHHA